jgi:hypothetical protein
MARVFQTLELSSATGLKAIQGINAVAFTSTATANRAISIPDGSGNLVFRNTADTLTNSTIADITNNVAATGLYVNSAVLNLSLASAPTAGQVLSATSGTQLAWVNPTALVPLTTIYSATVTATGTAPVVAFSIPTIDNTIYGITMRTAAAEETPTKAAVGVGYEQRATVRRDTGAASLVLLANQDTLLYSSASAAYTANISPNTGTGNIDVTVTCDAGTTAIWTVQAAVRTVP